MAAEADRELQKVYGDAVLSETTCRDWFRLSKDGDFDVDDRPGEGRPKTFEDADVIYYEESGRGIGHGRTFLFVYNCLAVDPFWRSFGCTRMVLSTVLY